MYAYRVSKAGANMVALNLHHDLSKRGIAVVALHPGMVATDLTKDYPGNFNYIQPADAARGLIARMDELDLAVVGSLPTRQRRQPALVAAPILDQPVPINEGDTR